MTQDVVVSDANPESLSSLKAFSWREASAAKKTSARVTAYGWIALD